MLYEGWWQCHLRLFSIPIEPSSAHSLHQGHWAASRRHFSLSAAEQAPGLLRNSEMSLSSSLEYLPGSPFPLLGFIAPVWFECLSAPEGDPKLRVWHPSWRQQAFLPGAGVWLVLTSALGWARLLWIWGDSRRRVSGARPSRIRIQLLLLIHPVTWGKLFHLSTNLLFLFCKHEDNSTSWGYRDP